MVGPQCNEYSYNDDPLTFYCQENWLSDPNREGLSEEPIGTSRFCPQKDEIPVGQMVDNAESWAENIIKPDKLDKDIKDLIEQMTKAGEAKDTSPIQDYCKCSAKLENGNPICKTDCQYNQWLINIPIVDKNGKVVGNRQQWQCSCTFLPCSGNPCKQVIDYLVDVWNTNKQLKSNFVDFYMAMLIEPRSDIIKQLTYSRKTTNSCSLTSSAYELQTRLLNCTRVKDEITPPFNTGNVLFDGKAINVGCYGQDLGFEVEKTLMDNWFCCEEQIK